jgi:hypothetical protein
MTAPATTPASQQAVIDAALVLLERMGLSLADLAAAPQDRPPVPTFADEPPSAAGGSRPAPSTSGSLRGGRAESDAAVRAGPCVRGGREVTARKKIGYRWHLRRLMADKDATDPDA